MSSLKVIGVCGRNGAGKTLIVQYLKDRHGYYTMSLSDAIRDQCAAEHIEMTRENLITMGNTMRGQGGPSVLATKTANRIEELNCGDGGGGATGSNSMSFFAIDSIRNPDEVNELRKRFSERFRLFGVDAPVNIRWQRVSQRQRQGDPLSIERFKELEERELSDDPNAQQLHKVLEMADEHIDNRFETIGELYKHLDHLFDLSN
jgi:dephospho-CoA kinase